MPERQTLLSYLDDYERRGRETVFVHHRGLRTVRWSYERLVQEAHQFARELQTRGIGSGDRVLLTGENSPEWAAAFWGCCLVGAVVVPLDKGSTPDFVRSVTQQTAAKVVVTDLRLVVTDPLLNDTSRLRDISLPKDLTKNAIVEIIYTSGTTSDPKGVVLTHQNLLANLAPLEREIRKYMKYEKFFHPIRFLNLVPLSHVFGQFMGMFVPQLMGGEVHFQESLNPAEIVRITRKNHVSIIVAVPRVLDALREWVERDFESKGHRSRELDEQLAAMESHGFMRRWWTFRKLHRQFGWKFWAFVSGGATLSERTEDFWQHLGFAVSQGYGMTETAALITVNHPFKRSRGSIGRLMPGYEVKLDESGEIMVRGASVSPGYWTSEGHVNSRNGEWLRTGDVGQLDANGNLFFKGRQKDVIVGAAGLNVYPEDLEAALDRQPEIRSSCVVAIESARGSEPFAAIIPHDSHANVQAAIKCANEQLAEYQQVRQWSIWPDPDFPRTATHKILKRVVAERLQSPSQDPSPGTPASEILNSDASTRLSDQLDSLGRVELLSSLEDRYQISLDEAAFTAATTVGDVQKLVRGEIHDQTIAPYPYPNWTRWRIVKLVRFVLYYTIILPITHIMSRMSVAGRKHVSQVTGPALFISNHVSLADHALILAGLPFRLRHKLAVAMEGEILRNWLHPPAGTSLPLRLRWLAQYFLVNLFFHVFPLPKKSGFRRSFAYAGECIDRGISVLVFPEGTRAPRGQMHMGHFKAGIGILAQSLNVPIIPIRLEGLYELKRRKQYFADPGMVRVIFGKPITFPTGTPPAAIANELEQHLVSFPINDLVLEHLQKNSV
ncbi:MAG TPA: AMP-binding protein [Pyrinomonadaceae bacterium]|nr:AMP-binding protein [Pyrinomonadaceae bacterium]